MPLGAFKLNSISAVISSDSQPIVVASGGTVTAFATNGTTYRIHRFATNGNQTFTVTTGGTVDVAVIGAGGGGGACDGGGTFNGGGGGGGGAVLYQPNVSVTPQAYTLTIGAGGTAGSNSTVKYGGDGGNTTAFGYTAGGGAGGGSGQQSTTTENTGRNGTLGSSGGGGGAGGGSSNFAKGGGTGSSPGTNGGNAVNTGAGGGGGGSGGSGANASSGSAAGNGGAGTNLSAYFGTGAGIGVSGVFAGGGGGGAGTTRGTGQAGGGNGGQNSAGSSGQVSTGSGGGGGGTSNLQQNGGLGSAGVVLIRYPLGPTISAIAFHTAVHSSSSTITIPSTIQAGDLAVLFDWGWGGSTSITGVVPTGFNSISNTGLTATPAVRGVATYRILTSADANTTVTGINAPTGNRKTLLIYRPTGVLGNVTVFGANSQAVATAPTNQSLVLSTYNTALDLGFAQYAAENAVTPGSSVTPTRTVGDTTVHKISTFEGGGFSNSTISMSDAGNNLLRSFILRLS
jgi:hypothetical protein